MRRWRYARYYGCRYYIPATLRYCLPLFCLRPMLILLCHTAFMFDITLLFWCLPATLQRHIHASIYYTLFHMRCYYDISRYYFLLLIFRCFIAASHYYATLIFKDMSLFCLAFVLFHCYAKIRFFSRRYAVVFFLSVIFSLFMPCWATSLMTHAADIMPARCWCIMLICWATRVVLPTLFYYFTRYYFCLSPALFSWFYWVWYPLLMSPRLFCYAQRDFIYIAR